ncbi:3945_t:CDS:2, partial [Funneliformis mosseae]
NTLEILENSRVKNEHATTQKTSSTCSAITFASDSEDIFS